MTTYASVHRAARKLRADACAHCGATERLQMALSPRTPRARRQYDERVRLWFSVSPLDYLTLCAKCRAAMDARVRPRAATIRKRMRRAPRCTVCGLPMAAGQSGGKHLGCADGTPAYGPLSATVSA